MALEQIIDLDEVILGWASSKLGHEYEVEKVDTSKLEVYQKSVIYHQNSQDWFTNENLHSEYFDNNEAVPCKWTYTHSEPAFKSTASWSIKKAFRSSKIAPIKIHLEYPVSVEEEHPLHVTYDTANLSQVRMTAEFTCPMQFQSPVTVVPFGCTQVCAQARVCRLKNAEYTTDICMSGSIKIVGHKKQRKFNKHEMTIGIAEVLSGKESQGFYILESTTDAAAQGRYVVFRMEGVCSGSVLLAGVVSCYEISSSV